MILGDSPELFTASHVGVLKAAQELQLAIVGAPPDNTQETAQSAIDVLGDVRKSYGLNRVALRTMSAFAIDRGLTIEEQVYRFVQFGEADLKASLGGFQYVRMGNIINSLCLDLFDVTVLRPVEPDDPDEGHMDMPLLIPVFAVDNIWAMN